MDTCQGSDTRRGLPLCSSLSFFALCPRPPNHSIEGLFLHPYAGPLRRKPIARTRPSIGAEVTILGARGSPAIQPWPYKCQGTISVALWLTTRLFLIWRRKSRLQMCDRVGMNSARRTAIRAADSAGWNRNMMQPRSGTGARLNLSERSHIASSKKRSGQRRCVTLKGSCVQNCVRNGLEGCTASVLCS